MENKKEMTIPNVSAATDAEQSLSKCTDNSIVNQDTDFKGYEQSFEEMQREILRQLDPSYLKTVSMTTLYDTVFEVQTPLIDGLLQRGTYLFVGSPKVGKSFMMAQLAYHISTGTPLWEYKVRKATVLYFALGIVSFQCFIKQFVINCLYIFIAVVDIEMSTSSVYIFCSELSAIVIDRAFTDHCTYRSLHFFISHL